MSMKLMMDIRESLSVSDSPESTACGGRNTWMLDNVTRRNEQVYSEGVGANDPVLKQKVDELFLRWISAQDTQSMLRENLRQLLHGEPLTATYPGASVSKGANKGQSPRMRPGSPPLSSSKLPSPRSPRRPLTTKNNHRAGNGNSKNF
ncbi:hypothetical protein MAR_014415 [Mya arenaria]|uniref:Uncharacterized protein n=1 Tax=Mya arenaria TaxID=6604 RepID=A0ABY7G6Q4_MYAAR|nr:hypothetical protein MAR_014415 [Mya arenaria]